MTTFFDKGLYERDPDLAQATLGQALSLGELTLLMGAGCSRDVGLPNWKELINRCCIHPKTIPPVSQFPGSYSPSADEMFSKMEKVRHTIKNDPTYVALVQDCLYEGIADGKLITEPSKLLRAIGALLMGSQRGKVSGVVTLNFDCVLESYLTLHGFVVQVVETWPKLLTGSDVTIYHPHGYLPTKKLGIASTEIIFDTLSVDKRLGTNSPWNDVFKGLLVSRVMLAVGLSGKDYLLRTLITAANEDVCKSQNRPLGFWLYLPDVEPDVVDQLRARGFIPIRVNTPEDLANFLFGICRKAREQLIPHGDNIL